MPRSVAIRCAEHATSGFKLLPSFERACVVQDDRTGRIKCERIRFWPRLAPRRGLDLHRSSRQHISQRGSKNDGARLRGLFGRCPWCHLSRGRRQVWPIRWFGETHIGVGAALDLNLEFRQRLSSHRNENTRRARSDLHEVTFCLYIKVYPDGQGTVRDGESSEWWSKTRPRGNAWHTFGQWHESS